MPQFQTADTKTTNSKMHTSARKQAIMTSPMPALVIFGGSSGGNAVDESWDESMGCDEMVVTVSYGVTL
jgi:hypothetical protein